MKEKVVLAFSGGLDTSFCAKYLAAERGLEVHAALVDTGGFKVEEVEQIEARARSLGVASFVCLNEVENFYRKCIRYMIFGNVLRNQTYPLSVSAERVFQALAVVNYAKKIGAKYLAHGSTGAGNDQVRFDLVFQIAAPDREILTPIRDLRLSRQAEIEYLQQHGIEGNWEKARYSINQGIWGTSVGGKETLTSHLPLPEEAFPSQLEAKEPQTIALAFSKGEPVAINGESHGGSVGVIKALNQLGSRYAIGRDIHVGDTIIGIKGRVGFEAPAALIIIKAHHALEKHVLTKWQAYWKEQLSNWYGMMLHEGQYLEPLMRNIEVFLEDSQQNVSGEVYVKLMPYRFEIQGIRSPHDLMAARFGQYGEMNNAWTGEDVKGFTKIISNQMKIYFQVNGIDQH
ncbi:MAG: argininosuccinate synthase [Cytophagales bacterium]|nr:argininosuccinate synthase [Bernardetiaceae bacterium]MDW8210224.1 argininosuccinate synthase [Cytophagales bacterium]